MTTSVGLNNTIMGGSISEVIENNGKPYNFSSFCDNCQSDSPKIKSTIRLSLPDILMVQLNRFETLIINGNLTFNKIEQYVEHPITFKLDNISYKLKSIIEQHGTTPQIEHYTVSIIDEHDMWIKCNDTQILFDAESPTMRYLYLYSFEL